MLLFSCRKLQRDHTPEVTGNYRGTLYLSPTDSVENFMLRIERVKKNNINIFSDEFNYEEIDIHLDPWTSSIRNTDSDFSLFYLLISDELSLSQGESSFTGRVQR